MSNIITSLGIIVSLFIATAGWLINWKQRINDRKPKVVATVINDFLNTMKGEKNLLIQIRNIGQTTAILQEFRIEKVESDKNILLSDGSKHLSFPLIPSQSLNSHVRVQTDKKYFVRVKYQDVDNKKTYVYSSEISGEIFRSIEPQELINMQ